MPAEMTTNNAEAILNALDSLIQCAADDGASGRVEYSPEIVRLRGEITAMFNTLASQPQAEREAVLWVNPDDLANRNFVGVNAVKAGHEQLGKHYTMPLFTHKPMQASEGADIPAELRKTLAEAKRHSPSTAGRDAIRRFQELAGDYVQRLIEESDAARATQEPGR